MAVVTFEPRTKAHAYVEETRLPWPVLVDEPRDTYRAYGMARGRLWDVWGPRTWWAYLKELARGRVPRSMPDDSLQLGGDMLIDPDGIVRFHHVGRGPADRPTVKALLRLVPADR